MWGVGCLLLISQEAKGVEEGRAGVKRFRAGPGRQVNVDRLWKRPVALLRLQTVPPPPFPRLPRYTVCSAGYITVELDTCLC